MTKSVSCLALFCSGAHTNGRPYIIDLDSANGTLVNDEMIPKQRYYELKSGDGQSLVLRRS